MAIPFVTTLDDSQFQAGLKNMEKGGKKVEASLTGSFNSMAKGIGASMAAAFTIQAVTGAAKAVLDFVGQLQDQAEALGVSTQILQGFQGAMANSGVSAEKFTKGMSTLAQSIQQAKEDTGSARDSFAALGIEFDSIAKDSPDQILLKIADGLAKATDPAAAYAAALDLVGKNQINFVAALKSGSQEFQDNASKIKTLTDAQVASIAMVGDAWDQAIFSLKAYTAEAALSIFDPAGEMQRKAEVKRVQNFKDQKQVAGGDTTKLDAMERYELLKGNKFKNRSQIKEQQKILEGMGVDLRDHSGLKNDFENLKASKEHLDRQKAKFGEGYSQEATAKKASDPREMKAMSETAELQAKQAIDSLTNDRVNAEKVADYQADLDAERTQKEKQDLKEFYAEQEKYEMEKQLDISRYEQEKLADLKKFYEEDAAYEMEKQADIAAYEKKKLDEKKKEAGQANVELAAKTLEMAQQDTALAQQKTNDARTSLRNALMGNPDPKETSQQKQVNRLMKRAESPKVEKEGLKIGKVGGKGVLDKKPPEALSTKRGAGKALKELNDAKRAEKDAKEQEELAKEQQKDMVTALKAIEKGINGN